MLPSRKRRGRGEGMCALQQERAGGFDFWSNVQDGNVTAPGFTR